MKKGNLTKSNTPKKKESSSKKLRNFALNLSLRLMCISHSLYLMNFCYENIEKNYYVYFPAIACVFILFEGIYLC